MRLIFRILVVCYFTFTYSAFAQSKIEINSLEINSNKKQSSINEFVVIQLKSKALIHSITDFNYLGDQWISMRLEDAQNQNIIENDKIVQYGILKPTSKLSQEFYLDFEVEKKYLSKEKMPVYIHSWSTNEELEEVLRLNNITEIKWDKAGKFCTVWANKSQIESISNNSFVNYIEPEIETRTPLLDKARALVNVIPVQLESPKGLGINGENINIGVWDYGLTGFHRDIVGQFLNVETDFYNIGGTQHTTMVTGAIASKGILREEFVGIAPKSKVFVYNFYGDIINEIISAKENYGVYVSNHSYNLGAVFKCFSNYNYNTASVQIDQLAIDEPNIVTVFAAGNSAVACAYDYKTIVSGFQYGKNLITVGNLQNNETFYPGSAKGPTNDGRLKPDVMAKGSSSFTPTSGIVLPTPTDNYTYGYGTSFASPIVTGTVGLMQEAYLNQFSSMPLSSTVKAILCNTAKDLGNKGPDYEYGFGKVDAYEAVKSIQNGNFIEDSIVNNEEKLYSFNIPNGTAEAKFLITWNEIPAAIPNTKVLVNNIDIEILSPEGNVIQPLVLNPFIPSQLAQEGKDSINNIEQIVIQFPTAGEFQLKVKGQNVVTENQKFSISYWFNSNEFVWNYPGEKDVLKSNLENIIRWRTSISDTIQLQYSIDSGVNWIEIGNQYADSSYYSWVAPDGHYPKVLLRALKMDDSLISVSDTFTISTKMNNIASKICFDNIRLSWTKVPEADKYIISILDEKNQWSDIGETDLNIFYFTNTKDGKDYIFAVRPVIGDFEGLKSNAEKVLARRQTTCNFPIKDVGISSIEPTAGTKETEYALTDSENINIIVSSYSYTIVNDVHLFYQVDTHSVQEVIIGDMTSNAVFTFTSDETYDFSKVGSYEVKAWLQSQNDINTENDSLIQIIKQAESVVASFPYFQNFENISDTLLYNQSVSNITNIMEWDYQKSETGRLVNLQDESFSPSNGKSLTIDSYLDNNNSQNNLYLNINLEQQKDSLVYLDYRYIKRDNLGGDSLFIKVKGTDQWVLVKELYDPNNISGEKYFSERLNLSKVLYDNGLTFSNHNILKFSFNNYRPTTSISTAGGYTLDDIHVYRGYADLSLESIEVPTVHCIDQSSFPLKIPVVLQIKNNSPLLIPANEVDLLIQVNGELQFTEKIAQDILPYQEFAYELNESLNYTNFESSIISATLEYSEDSITVNNSIENKSIVFLNEIQELSLELTFDDENSEIFIPSGSKYSWEVGKPSKNYLYNIADNPGKSWVTGINNYYNENEESYLYIGCFDPSLLNINSEIAFLMAYNTEYSTDGIWMEYSYDGESWYTYGSSSIGYNWYNTESSLNIWDGDRLNWQVTSVPLSSFYGDIMPFIYFRYAFFSNEYIQLEGIAIDNFRINNNLVAQIPDSNVTASAISSGSGKIDLVADGIVYGSLDDKGQTLGKVTLEIIVNDSLIPTNKNRFLLPRYYHLQTDNQATQAYDLTLFNKNEEYLNYLFADKNARRMGEIGYLVYNGLNTDRIYSNNHFDEDYIIYHPDSIEFWPYSNGYELRFSLDQKDTEIYLTSNLSSKDAYPFVAITNIEVYRTDTSNHTTVEWMTEKEDGVINYLVQHSDDGLDFVTLDSINAHGANVLYQLTDSLNNYTGDHFYRIITTSTTDSTISLIDSVSYEYIAIGLVHHQNNHLFKVNYSKDGWLNINWESLDLVQNLRIVDISGRLLEEKKELLHTGQQAINFQSLQNAPSGMYFLQIIQDNESISAKFVKSE